MLLLEVILPPLLNHGSVLSEPFVRQYVLNIMLQENDECVCMSAHHPGICMVVAVLLNSVIETCLETA